jgi:hypothetical protein
MKYALALALVFSPLLSAKTECVSEVEIAKIMEDVQGIYESSREGIQQRALNQYDNQIEKLNNTLLIRHILVENDDLFSLKQIDLHLTNQAQFVYKNLSKMTDSDLRERAVRTLKEVNNSNEKLQFSVKFDLDLNLQE